jgi:hypothetical protein
MHSLESALFALGTIIRQEVGDQELAEEAVLLASESHAWAPPKSYPSGDWLEELAQKLMKRAGI